MFTAIAAHNTTFYMFCTPTVCGTIDSVMLIIKSIHILQMKVSNGGKGLRNQLSGHPTFEYQLNTPHTCHTILHQPFLG